MIVLYVAGCECLFDPELIGENLNTCNMTHVTWENNSICKYFQTLWSISNESKWSLCSNFKLQENFLQCLFFSHKRESHVPWGKNPCWAILFCGRFFLMWHQVIYPILDSLLTNLQVMLDPFPRTVQNS